VSSRGERLSLNQATFRSANEGMTEVLNVHESTLVPFLCECADLDCLGRLEATLAEFEEAHAGANRYFILRGHLRVEGEEILVENERYEVVVKTA
jgi:hypothetical protein